MSEHAIAWFAIPVTDRARARAFYSTVLDIEMPDFPTPMGTCSVFPQVDTGGVSGSLNDFMNAKPSQDSGVTIWLSTADVQAALDKVEAAGGQILSGRESIGEFGFIAMIVDTEGNRIGLHAAH